MGDGNDIEGTDNWKRRESSETKEHTEESYRLHQIESDDAHPDGLLTA